MSQENVEIVRRLLRFYADGNRELVGFSEDAEWVPDASVFPEGRPVRGRDAIRAWADDVESAWVDLDIGRIATEFRDVGVSQVLSRGEWGGRGAASGVEIRSDLSGVWTLHNGQVTRVDWFFDRDAALKAVGLEE